MDIKTSDLTPHPKNAQIYDTPTGIEWEHFLLSIKENGILEPLLINSQNVIISGHRRWQAAIELNLAQIPCLVLGPMDKLNELKTIVEANRYRKKLLHEIRHEAEILEDVETRLARERQKIAGQGIEVIIDKGRTSEKIAKALGIGSHTTYDRLKKIWMVADSEPSVVEALAQVDSGKKSLNSVWKLTQKFLYGSAKEEEFGFDLQVYNKWYFGEVNLGLGINHPGRLPGQLIQNVVHYWSEPGDLIVDPFGGGGTTLDVCQGMERDCLIYDIAPVREDIKQWDISNGFPAEAKDCQLIFCFKPGTKIEGIDFSLRNIESIQKGEDIPVESNRTDIVKEPLKRYYNGKMIQIKAKRLPTPIDCTTNHKFLVLKKQDIINKRSAINQRPWMGHTLDSLTPQWVEAKYLEIGDNLLTPCHSQVVNNDKMEIKVIKTDIHFNEKLLPDFIPINGNFFRWLGYYLSDGSHTEHTISFTFGLHEMDLALDVACLNKELFNLETAIEPEYRGKKALTVRVNSNRLIKTIKDFIPNGSNTKSIHPSLMLCPPEEQLELVYSYWRGDGFINTNQAFSQQVIINTTSEKMAWQLFRILLRNKLTTSLTGKVSKKLKGQIMWSVDIQDKRIKKELNLLYGDRNETNHFYKDYFLCPIINTKEYNYSGDVYNLSMEEIHSYTANGVIVSNCDPPYWNMLEKEYLTLSKDSCAGLSMEGFKTFLHKLVVDAFLTLEFGGHFACIMMQQYSKLPVGVPFIDWPFLVETYMTYAGFQIVNHVINQWPTSIFQAYDVNNAKNHKIMLGITGGLIVGRKP